jgi:hypothetical protein
MVTSPSCSAAMLMAERAHAAKAGTLPTSWSDEKKPTTVSPPKRSSIVRQANAMAGAESRGMGSMRRFSCGSSGSCSLTKSA